MVAPSRWSEETHLVRSEDSRLMSIAWQPNIGNWPLKMPLHESLREETPEVWLLIHSCTNLSSCLWSIWWTTVLDAWTTPGESLSCLPSSLHFDTSLPHRCTDDENTFEDEGNDTETQHRVVSHRVVSCQPLLIPAGPVRPPSPSQFLPFCRPVLAPPPISISATTHLKS